MYMSNDSTIIEMANRVERELQRRKTPNVPDGWDLAMDSDDDEEPDAAVAYAQMCLRQAGRKSLDADSPGARTREKNLALSVEQAKAWASTQREAAEQMRVKQQQDPLEEFDIAIANSRSAFLARARVNGGKSADDKVRLAPSRPLAPSRSSSRRPAPRSIPPPRRGCNAFVSRAGASDSESAH